MIALWMLYSTVIAAILGVAAALVDRTVGSVIRHRRLVWIGALLASVAIPAAVAFVPRTTIRAQGAGVVRHETSPVTGTAEHSAIKSRIAELLGKADSRTLGRLDRPFAIAWAVSAALALVAYGVASMSLRRRRRTWRSTLVEGEPVLLAPAVGPAVVGAVRPEIVVPEWSLDLAPEQRALMIEHERQHVLARDPLVLHAAAILAMLTPWNVAMWWLNRRLRLAVELDCDARVLAGGFDVRAYGTLLLDVCSRRRPPSAALAPALLERTSSLTRRIVAMHPAPARYARSKAALGTALALGIVVLACDMPTPDMVAPDGTNAPMKRVFGKAGAATPLAGVDNLKRFVAQHFPSVARGEGEPAILFVVRSSTGEILATEAQAASAMARARAPQTERARPRSPDTAAVEAVGGNERVRVRANAQNARAALPGRIGTVAPNDIEAVEVSKHGEGVVAPKPVSVIVITLKPGAEIPAPPAGQ